MPLASLLAPVLLSVSLAAPAAGAPGRATPRPVHGSGVCGLSWPDAAVGADSTVRLCAGGDLTLGTTLDTAWVRRESRRAKRRAPLPPDSLLAPLGALVRDADVLLLNVEGAIGAGPAPPKCTAASTGCFALRQPVHTAAALRELAESAVVVGNLANNHANDAGAPGLRETVRRLSRAGVLVTGVDSLATAAITASGDTVGVLGFSTSSGPDLRDTVLVERLVARAAASFPRLVVTMHLGAEGALAQRTRDSTELFMGENRGNPVAFARAAARAGADVVIGHGPHVMRAVEWRSGTLVIYSLGNLLTYGPFSLRPPMDRGAIACVSLGPAGEVMDAVLRSTHQTAPGRVVPDPAGRAAVLVDSLSRLDFPRTGARLIPEAAILPPR